MPQNIYSDSKKKWAIAHPNYNKEYRAKNKDQINKKRNEWCAKHRDKLREISRKNNLQYKDKIKEWRVKNRLLLNEKNRLRTKIRYLENRNNHAIKTRLRAILKHAFKAYSIGGKYKPADYYGIDFDAICKQLGSKPAGNYHIDHIRPLCSFNFDNPEEIKQAFAPENHQWLTAEENLKKGGSYSA